MTIKDYDNELLHMAHDLAVRLLPAFENTKTGIPYPRVGKLTFPLYLIIHHLLDLKLFDKRNEAEIEEESGILEIVLP